MLNGIKYRFKLRSLRKEWKIRNKHNKTTIVKLCNINNIKVGKYSYGPIKVYDWNIKGEELIIGNFVSIADGVTFILGGNHQCANFSTYPFNTMICGGDVSRDVFSKGKIEVKDDVWIGLNATILSGVTIGKGAVIGAGSVVSKDIPPYAIVVGNPARIVKYRFSEEIIEKQLQYDMSNLSEAYIRENVDLFYNRINIDELNRIIR